MNKDKLQILGEKFKKEKEILAELNISEIDNKFLDQGEIDNIFYFGFKLNNKDAIITSEGEILRNCRTKIKGEYVGENEIEKLFHYNNSIGSIAPTIINETIKKIYMKKLDKKNKDLIDIKELYSEIKDRIIYYMDFSNKNEIADVFTCWIIATYCYSIFYWFPHILINAPSSSGKSKCGKLLLYLSFRGYDLGSSGGVSSALMYRTIDDNRGTILIDEFEQNNGKYSSETQQLVNQILNASASRDAYILRLVQDSNGNWYAKKFSIYCPKIACNISGINPTSLSRFISFSWLKTDSEKGKRKPEREKDKMSFIPIREKLYILILENYKKIKEIYSNIQVNLSNRDEDNWLPLFTIARFIDNEVGNTLNVENQLNKYLQEYKELQIQANDDISDFFNELYEKISDQEKYYSPKEISEMENISEIFQYMKSPAHRIGKLLKTYKFKTNNRAGGHTKYLLSKENVKHIIDLYFSTNIISHNNTNNTNNTKQHKTTQENVPLCEVCAISSEGGCDNSKEEFIQDVIGLSSENNSSIDKSEEVLFPSSDTPYILSNDIKSYLDINGNKSTEQIINRFKGTTSQVIIKETLNKLSLSGDLFELRKDFWGIKK